jgi:hypothetical protein
MARLDPYPTLPQHCPVWAVPETRPAASVCFDLFTYSRVRDEPPGALAEPSRGERWSDAAAARPCRLGRLEVVLKARTARNR